LIEIRNLTKTYPIGTHEVNALRGVSLDMDKGEFVAIMGPSGSGKSTLMNLLGCLDRPSEGTYRLDEVNVKDLNDDELAEIRNRKIGFVFQTFNLLGRNTALENVELPLFYAGIHDTKEKALRALKEVGLSHRADHRPNELSGGERQRVAIARAIVLDPPLILADEPTGNLDTKTGKEIMEIFGSLNKKGTTIILVTHEHDIAKKCPRIIYTRDGVIEKDTTRGPHPDNETRAADKG
jgi:putative ABC transport system ATP-binding protein